MYSHEKTVLERISSSLKRKYPENIVSVYAFGSRVRGDHAEGSDFDVLVNVKNRFIAVEVAIIDALNAVRALHILEGVNPETHNVAITAISLRFVKPGLLPVEVIKSIKLLLSRRTDVDYGDFESIDTTEAKDSLEKSEHILQQINTVRKKLIADLVQ